MAPRHLPASYSPNATPRHRWAKVRPSYGLPRWSVTVTSKAGSEFTRRSPVRVRSVICGLSYPVSRLTPVTLHRGAADRGVRKNSGRATAAATATQPTAGRHAPRTRAGALATTAGGAAGPAPSFRPSNHSTAPTSTGSCGAGGTCPASRFR